MGVVFRDSLPVAKVLVPAIAVKRDEPRRWLQSMSMHNSDRSFPVPKPAALGAPCLPTQSTRSDSCQSRIPANLALVSVQLPDNLREATP